ARRHRRRGLRCDDSRAIRETMVGGAAEAKTPARGAAATARLTSARFSKFVIQRGTLGHELRKPKGTGNSMILVPLFDLKFLSRTRDPRCRNFKSAALGTGSARHSPILFPGRQD